MKNIFSGCETNGSETYQYLLLLWKEIQTETLRKES